MTMRDRFDRTAIELSSPGVAFYEIKPSDDDLLPERPRAVRVGQAGDVAVVGEDGVTAVFANCFVGEILPIRPVQVRRTGTTAGRLVALL